MGFAALNPSYDRQGEGAMTEPLKRSYVKRDTAQARGYSQAVVTEGGRVVWLAGQVAIEDSTGRSLAADFDGQVRGVLARLVAGQGHPVHDPAEAVVIVDRVVLGAAVVPEGERADRPAEAAGEFGPGLVREQKAQQRRALLLGHTLEPHGVPAIDIE